MKKNDQLKSYLIKRSDSEKAIIDKIKYYLLFGALPWWTSIQKGECIEDDFVFAIKNHTAAFYSMMLELGKKENVRRRIAYSLSTRTIKLIVKVLEPSNYNIIVSYSEHLEEKQKKEQIVKTGRENFSSAIWQFILNFLLNERGTYFNTRSFIKSLIRQMAVHYNVEYHYLLTRLSESFSSINVVVSGSLPLIIRDIYTEDVLSLSKRNEQNDVFERSLEVRDRTEEVTIFFLESNLIETVLTSGYLLLEHAGISRNQLSDFLKLYIRLSGRQKFVETLRHSDLQSTPTLIVNFFSGKELCIYVIETLVPAYRNLILNVSADLQQNFKAGNFINDTSYNFSIVKWQAIITALLNYYNKPFDKIGFIKQLSIQIARAYHLDVHFWLNAMISQPVKPMKVLSYLIEYRKNGVFEAFISPSEVAGNMIKASDQLKTIPDIEIRAYYLLYFIKSGKWPKEISFREKQNFSKLFDDLSKQQKEDFIKQIAKLSGNIKTVQRLAQLVGNKAVDQIISSITSGKLTALCTFSLKTDNNDIPRNKLLLLLKTFLLAYFLQLKVTNRFADLSIIRELVLQLSGEAHIPVLKFISYFIFYCIIT